VEQLRVHVRNLSMLGVNGTADSKGRVELFERGYGKDAAGIAKEAITYGKFPGSSTRMTEFLICRNKLRIMISMSFLLTQLGGCKIMRSVDHYIVFHWC
jgi:hypothetical protein